MPSGKTFKNVKAYETIKSTTKIVPTPVTKSIDGQILPHCGTHGVKFQLAIWMKDFESRKCWVKKTFC